MSNIKLNKHKKTKIKNTDNASIKSNINSGEQNTLIYKIKLLISLTKPGIIVGNLFTLIAGFFLAVAHHRSNINNMPLNIYLYCLITIFGISFVIASGCVFNNYIDQDIDSRMQRTKNRVLVKKLISNKIAIVYAFILGLIGLFLLYFFTNKLAFALALFGFIIYLFIYTMIFKRTSVYGTLIGSMSGAVPPVVGYCAITNSFDIGAIILFAMLSFWQMPHSFAIAIYRLNDYKNAKIPVLPLVSGIESAKRQMLFYIIMFILAALLLFIYSYVGYIYLFSLIIIAIFWIRLNILGFKIKNNTTMTMLKDPEFVFNDTAHIVWAKKMFVYSVISIMILSIVIVINA